MLVQALHRQYLRALKNNLQFSLLKDFSAQRSMLNGGYNHAYANALELKGVSDSIQLMAINAELNALNNINYLA